MWRLKPSLKQLKDIKSFGESGYNIEREKLAM